MIDDEPAIRYLLRRILEPAGYKVLEAQDGMQGLTLFQAHQTQIGLIVLDFFMPVATGYEFLAGLKRLDPMVGIIALTGFPTTEPLPDGVRLLSKPINEALLKATVAELLPG